MLRMTRPIFTALLTLIAISAMWSIPASAIAAPPTATTEAATAVRYEEATLKGTVNPEGSATSYYFEYGKTEAYGTKIPVSPESVGSGSSNIAVSQTATGLSQSTEYHFRVVAEGETTANGKDATFTTAGFNFSFGEEGSGNGQFKQPELGIATDSEGNIWVSDTGNNRIQKFNSKGEYLAQFGKEGAGNGEFKSPKGLALDPSGNIWVVDSGNNRVQKFNSKGEYLLKFGEAGSGEGQFNSPAGITFSGTNAFVVDSGNNRVQKFNLTSSPKFLTQIGKEGSGDGEFKSPTGVVIEASAIWVTDTGNNRVQKFSAITFNYASKFGEKGSSKGQFESPSGIVSDFQGRFWIVDSGNNRAEKFNHQGENQDQVGEKGSGAGQLSNPTGIAIPSVQKLLILDTGNNRVEGWTVKAEPPMIGTTSVSNRKTNSATLSTNIFPEALATTYWFEYGTTESYGTKIPVSPESVGSGSSSVHVEQTATGLSKSTTYHFRAVAESAAGLVVDGDKTFKLVPPKATTEAATGVKETQATLNGKVDPEGSATSYWFEYGKTTSYGTKIPIPSQSIGSGTTGVAVSQTPTGLSEGTTYHFRVMAENEVDASPPGEDKTFTTTLKLPDATTEAATAVKLTQATLNATVIPLGLETTYWFEYGKTTSYGTKIPASPELIGSGSFPIAASQTATGLSESTTYHFRVVAEAESGTRNGADKSFTTGPSFSLAFGKEGTGKGQFKHPAGIALDAKGDLWVVDMENKRVEELDGEGKYLFEFGKAGSGECQLSRPASIAIDSKGDVWITDAGNNRVEEFNAEGKCLIEFGKEGTGEGQFKGPEGIAIDAEGDIWVADTYNGRLQKFDAEGKFLEAVGSFGSKPGQLVDPTDIDIDSGGNIWVAEWGNQRVSEFDEAGEFVQLFGEEGSGNGQFLRPDTIEVDESGSVWVIDEVNNRVQAFDEEGKYLSKLGAKGSGEGQFSFRYPTGIASGSEGSLWIADSLNNRVQKWIP